MRHRFNNRNKEERGLINLSMVSGEDCQWLTEWVSWRILSRRSWKRRKEQSEWMLMILWMSDQLLIMPKKALFTVYLRFSFCSLDNSSDSCYFMGEVSSVTTLSFWEMLWAETCSLDYSYILLSKAFDLLPPFSSLPAFPSPFLLSNLLVWTIASFASLFLELLSVFSVASALCSKCFLFIYF